MSDHINDVAPLLILHTHFPKHVIDVKVASNLNATNLYNSAPSVFSTLTHASSYVSLYQRNAC